MKPNTVLHVRDIVTPANELEGVPEDEWGTVKEVWASIVPMAGREYYQAQQMESTVSHRIETEFFAGAHPRMKLIKPNEEDPANPLRTFNVKSVVNINERNRKLQWMCEEVV